MNTYYRPKNLHEVISWIRKYYPDFKPVSHKQAWKLYYLILQEHDRGITI